MLKSWIYQRQFGSIEYNLFRFRTPLLKIRWKGRWYSLHLLLRLMARRNIKYRALRIAGCIGVSYSTLSDGRVMIPLLGNQRSSSMGYRLWTSSINGTQGNPDHWRMFSEDLEPKGGILSRRNKVRRYLGIIEERYGRCGRNCITERRRRWKMRRKRRDGGGII